MAAVESEGQFQPGCTEPGAHENKFSSGQTDSSTDWDDSSSAGWTETELVDPNSVESQMIAAKSLFSSIYIGDPEDDEYEPESKQVEGDGDLSKKRCWKCKCNSFVVMLLLKCPNTGCGGKFNPADCELDYKSDYVDSHNFLNFNFSSAGFHAGNCNVNVNDSDNGDDVNQMKCMKRYLKAYPRVKTSSSGMYEIWRCPQCDSKNSVTWAKCKKLGCELSMHSYEQCFDKKIPTTKIQGKPMNEYADKTRNELRKFWREKCKESKFTDKDFIGKKKRDLKQKK